MEIGESPINMRDSREGLSRCLLKAIEKTQSLLFADALPQDYDQIHSAKSILYAAIEQIGMKMERLSLVQERLRDLLFIVTAQYDSPGQDWKAGLRMLEEIKTYIDKL